MFTFRRSPLKARAPQGLAAQGLAVLGLAALGLVALGRPQAVHAAEPIKIGAMLPFTGTYAALGEAGLNGLKLALAENGEMLGGRPVEIITLDDESDPGRAPANASKLIKSEGVDVLYGTVHSGVAMGMVKVARETDTLMVIPNAGAAAATGPLCAPNIFRTSMTMWQDAYPMAKVAIDKGYKKVVTITWKYGAGEESVRAFKEGFEDLGGVVLKEIFVPFPNVEFQANLAEIAALEPDAVFTFFAGGGAVKFVKDYDAAGLKRTIPLLGSGFLTEGTLAAQGAAADGVLTTLHYADSLETEDNKAFRAKYKEAYGKEADLYAVQGYDAGKLLAIGLEAVGGDMTQRDALYAAMQAAEFASPRGKLAFSKAHNPVQDVYLREAMGGENRVVDVAAEGVTDPALGCSM